MWLYFAVTIVTWNSSSGFYSGSVWLSQSPLGVFRELDNVHTGQSEAWIIANERHCDSIFEWHSPPCSQAHVTALGLISGNYECATFYQQQQQVFKLKSSLTFYSVPVKLNKLWAVCCFISRLINNFFSTSKNEISTRKVLSPHWLVHRSIPRTALM